MFTFAEKQKGPQQQLNSFTARPHNHQASQSGRGMSAAAADDKQSAMTPLRFGHNFGATRVSSGKLGGPLPEGMEQPPVTGDAGVNAPRTPVTTPAPADAGTPAPPVNADAGAPVAATPPKLSKNTQAGPTASDCGGFSWVIQWELDKPSPKGGWVVQKVELPYAVKGCDGKAVDPTKTNSLQPSWYPLWEAWQINANQKVTNFAEGGDKADDTYATNSPGAQTKGSYGVTGTAEFYEGLTLPATMKVTNKAPTWILPASRSEPALSGGTGAISHNLTATWDCCSTDKAATKTTTLATV